MRRPALPSNQRSLPLHSMVLPSQLSRQERQPLRREREAGRIHLFVDGAEEAGRERRDRRGVDPERHGVFVVGDQPCRQAHAVGAVEAQRAARRGPRSNPTVPVFQTRSPVAVPAAKRPSESASDSRSEVRHAVERQALRHRDRGRSRGSLARSSVHRAVSMTTWSPSPTFGRVTVPSVPMTFSLLETQVMAAPREPRVGSVSELSLAALGTPARRRRRPAPGARHASPCASPTATRPCARPR